MLTTMNDLALLLQTRSMCDEGGLLLNKGLLVSVALGKVCFSWIELRLPSFEIRINCFYHPIYIMKRSLYVAGKKYIVLFGNKNAGDRRRGR